MVFTIYGHGGHLGHVTKIFCINFGLLIIRRYFFCGSFMFLFWLVFAMSVRVCLYVLCGHLLGKGWPLGSRLWCLLWVCNFPIGILGQVWYLIVSIPDLCTFTYFHMKFEFNWANGLWENYVLIYWWDSNMSDLSWKVKGQHWPFELIYSHCLIRLNISSENND